MDCRIFRKHHFAFVDDTLPGTDLVAMERHRQECATCARHDTVVRRSLLVVRNLPEIEPSADFADRLQRRLADTNIDRRPVHLGTRLAAPHFGATAMTLAACALFAAGVTAWSGSDASTRVAEFTAAAREVPIAVPLGVGNGTGMPSLRLAFETTPLPNYTGGYAMPLLDIDQQVDPGLVASASAGLMVWPGLMMADDLPRPFVEAGFSLAELVR